MLVPDDIIILDIPNTSENSLVGQTLQRPLATSLFPEDRKNENRGDSNSQKYGPNKDTYAANQGNILL